MIFVKLARIDRKIYPIIIFFVGFSLLISCMIVRKSENTNRQISPLTSLIEASRGNPGLANQKCPEEPSVVRGALFKSGKPVANARLYLGSIIKNGVVAFDRTRSITTTTDEGGKFEFRDVPPGEYGLVLDTIMSSYLLLWPDKKEPILIVVTESQGVCLGEINFPVLPQP